jgi:hypothetical protein
MSQRALLCTGCFAIITSIVACTEPTTGPTQSISPRADIGFSAKPIGPACAMQAGQTFNVILDVSGVPYTHTFTVGRRTGTVTGTIYDANSNVLGTESGTLSFTGWNFDAALKYDRPSHFSWSFSGSANSATGAMTISTTSVGPATTDASCTPLP